jgi:D-beta-D-heptose 7-phosphate kinase/D-beta-D-heptose 1-phosphate adenosyltransferase
MKPQLVIVGDVLLDVDIAGTSRRLCPGAPVPVIEEAAEHSRPGGAGLAALLAAADGRDVALVTALGDDEPGHRLRAMLEQHASVTALHLHGGTPSKVRIQSDGQSVARLDFGEGHAVDGPIGPRVAAALDGAAAVLVSDYGRGVAGHAAIRELLARLPRTVPVVWDPHPHGARPVTGTRLLTPNENEATTLAKSSGSGLGAAARHARQLAYAWRLPAVAVTLGEAGALLYEEDRPPLFAPANAARSGDTCGAGDSFATYVAGALADGGRLADAVREGVRHATDFVGAGGASAVAGRLTGSRPVAPEPPADAWDVIGRVRRAGGTVVATGGCFDILHAGHVSLLDQARRLGDCLVVCVNSDESVRRCKGPERPVTTVADRVRVLEALADVDAVMVFSDDTPVTLLDRLRPDIWVKGADYAETRLPETETVRSYGGEVMLLPFLEGRSTTRLLAKGAAK